MEQLRKQMNVPFGSRLTAFVAAAILMFIVASVVSALLVHSGITTPRLRIATVVQDVLMFVLPPLVAAVIACRLPARLLLLNRPAGLLPYLVIVMVLITSIPAMNWLVSLNGSMSLPPALSGLEQWMRQTEETAAANVDILMGGTSVADLIADLLIVAVLAGFSEEIFFRGGLQQLLITRPMNHHAAIWLTAVVFSTIHMQFFGFFPRLLLGAYFGYLAWWSRTLWLPVCAHILNNATVVVSSWLHRRGLIGNTVDTIGSQPASTADAVTIAVSVIATAALIYAVMRLCRSERLRAATDKAD